MSEGFERHARTVTVLTFASRITGLVRDASLSRVFGAGLVTDALLFAFLVPNLFRRLFGEGAISAAFLPVYARLDRDDPELARRVASLVIGRITLLLGAIVLLGEGLLFTLSLRSGHENLAIWLTMLMLPYMPLVCLVALLGAMLQVRGRFGPTAMAPIILNASIVVAAIAGSAMAARASAEADRQVVLHVGLVAVAVVLAGMAQVLWSLVALRRSHADGSWWTRDTGGAREAGRTVFRQALPMIVGMGVLQLNTLVDGIIASYPTVVGPTLFGVDYPLEEGAMSAVSFAQRLYQFPLGVFGIAVATAIFPALARVADDDDAFADIVRRGLRLVVFIGLPASVGLVLVREPLARAILEGGDFTAADTERVARVLLGYAPAVWAYSMMQTLTRAYYARGDARTPVRAAVAMVAFNLALNCTLIWTPLREAGLAVSTAISSGVQVLILLLILRRRIGALVDGTVGTSWLRTASATAIMGACVYAVMPAEMPETWRATAAQLVALTAIGATTYGLTTLVFRMPELRWALGRSDRR